MVTERLVRRLLVGRSACRDASHPRVDKGEVSEHRLVNAVDERPVGTRQPRLLIDKLFVKVAAVTGRRLQRGGQGNTLIHAMIGTIHF